MAPETPPPPSPPVSADFVRPGDYTTPFRADALAAFPRAPRVTLKALWWYLTRKRVRARNYLHEVVGRRLIFAMRLHLRPAASPPPTARALRCAVIVPVLDGVPEVQATASLASVIPGACEAGGKGIQGNSQTILDPLPLRCSPAGDDTAHVVTIAAAARELDHDLILVLRAGDVLLPGAGDAIAAAFADDRVEAAFADEVVALPGLVLPVPKPDLDEDLLAQVDYVGPFLAIRRETLIAMGGADDARTLLRRIVRERGEASVGHILGPVVGRDLRRPDAAPAFPFQAAAPRALPDPPLVSVIVPTRDRIDLLAPCLDGLLHATDYPRLEVIVADNGSVDPETLARLAEYARDPRVRIVPMPGPFNFSRLNNDAAALARGDILVFLNNDIEVIEPTWLGALVAEAVRPEIGAVGATLLYPNGLVQHAGVVVGLAGGPAGHAFHLFREDHPGFLHMLRATRRVSAVTAACLAVRRETFLAHGGFDAEAFPVALNDVDLCLRLDAADLRNLNVGRVRLLHKESASRPSDRHPAEEARYARELAAFTARWPHRLERDPWYNPHHGWAAADFSVPRWTGIWPSAAPC